MALRFKKITSLPDFRILENLAREIWEEHYTSIIGADQVNYMMEKFQKAEVMHRQALNEDYQYYFVIAEDSLAGYMSFETRNQELFLSKFYLEKGFRGRGLARGMMRFLEEMARNENLIKIGLTVNKYNTSSIGAYQAIGFEIIEPVVFDIGGGYIMDDFRMERKLL
jgi:ribosomal protein S18 acetylase RimI-like enzyme